MMTNIRPRSSVVKPKIRKGKSNGSKIAIFRSKVNYADLALNPFPPVLLRKFRYCDAYVSTISNVGTATTQTFRLNAMHDIDLTGTGHQPRGYDQLVSTSGPYSKYRVMKARGRILAHHRAANTANIDAAVVVAYPSISSSVVSAPSGGIGSILGNLELPGAFCAFSQQAGPPGSAEFDFNIWDLFGKQKSQYLDDEGYGGDAGAVPALAIYLITQTQSLAGSSANDAGVAVLMVEFEYTVRLEQPVPLTAS
jgi:hypothetical protein